MVLNLIFLKYATAVDMDKLLTPFYGEGATHSTYDPANLLILEDNGPQHAADDGTDCDV